MPGFGKDKTPRDTSRRGLLASLSKGFANLFFSILLAWSVSGCAPLQGLWARPSPTGTPAPSPKPSSTQPVQPSPMRTVSPVPTRETSSPVATITAGQSVTLTIWLPPEMVPDLAPTPEVGAFIASAHAGFQAAQRGTRLLVAPKALYGPGGMLDLLLATQPVAPWRLPDIALVDASELPALIERGLATPLNDLIPSTVWDDLFPFALEAVSADGGLYGVPFQVDIPLLVYHEQALAEPPQRWEQLLAGTAKIVFPAAQGEDGAAADLFMVQYLARGGKVTTSPLALDTVIVARVLRDYRTAFERGILVPEARESQTWENSWAFYLAGNAEMTLAGSWQYLRDRALLTDSRCSAVPTVSTGRFTLARSLVWVILAQDPAQRRLAAEYVTMMMDVERLGEWSAVSDHLPARRSSYPMAFEPGLGALLEEQLVRASPYPLSPMYLKARSEIARAIEDVLDGITTPERAASSLVMTISRLR